MLTGSDNLFPLVRLLEDTLDSSPAPAGQVHLRADAATKLLYLVDDAGTVTAWAGAGYAPGGTDVAVADGGTGASTAAAARTNLGLVLGTDVAAFGADPLLTEAAAPSTPAAGKVIVYAKTDGRVYSKDDAGVEYGPFDVAGGAGGPLLYQDSVALHASGDEFTTTALTGWTLGGGLATSDATLITTEPYDDDVLEIVFSAQLKRMLKSLPGTWSQIILTCHGQTDATSPANSTGAMLGLCVVDSAGAGHGVSFYNDTATYTWIVSGYGYAGSGAAVPNAWGTNSGGLAASNHPWMYRLRKSGTNIIAGISYNGGLSWSEATATAIGGLTYDRFGIIRLYTAGGAGTKLRVGRINII